MKYLCETKELAIGYGGAPLASGITLGAVPGQILASSGQTARANPPCSKRWRASWPPWAGLSCWMAAA